MAIVAVTVVIVSKFLIGQAYGYVTQKGSKEITVIFSVAVAFLALQVCYLFIFSIQIST